MKSLVFSFALVFGLSAQASGGHGDHGGDQHPVMRVHAQAVSEGNLVAGEITYKFTLKDTDSGENLSDRDLRESHTKKLHFIAYDISLQEFNHVHPIFENGSWTAQLSFPVNGQYFLWAQGELNDGTEFTAPLRAEVVNGKPAWSTTDLGDHRTGSDKSTIVTLSNRAIRAGKMAMIDYTVSREDGLSPIITPYLGAMAHVIAVSPDGEQMLHVHPMDGATADTGMLHTTFPKPGDYRLWVQLVDREELKTVPLSVSVLK
ncbi:MAG: hypothetical protein J7501_11515 [Bdellovibrio sp.]|nr:hypothetical protein [Bdellovibrio sp.]